MMRAEAERRSALQMRRRHCMPSGADKEACCAVGFGGKGVATVRKTLTVACIYPLVTLPTSLQIYAGYGTM
jgi:hypothetical protein